jgi:UDP:flavonoid glycosyltransferase YjiC (YdhE family)
MNSVNEALYFDVPPIVVPPGADQASVGKRVAELGGQ